MRVWVRIFRNPPIGGVRTFVTIIRNFVPRLMKNQQKLKQFHRKRRRARVRARVLGTPNQPRLAVFKSALHIYAQVIDDVSRKTLVSASDLKLKNKKVVAQEGLNAKVAKAYEVGKLVGEACRDKGIKKVIFDRGGFKYHGRIKAIADGARSAGLEF